MPLVQITPDLEMYYRDDGFADSWRTPDAVLLAARQCRKQRSVERLAADAGATFPCRAARHAGFRVSRPPWRSTTAGRSIGSFPISSNLPTSSGSSVSTSLRQRLHVRSPCAWWQGTPERVRTLTVLGGLVSGEASVGGRAASWVEHLETKGVESWARWTMPGRLGSSSSAEMREGWAKLMGKTPFSTQLGFIRSVPAIDVRGDLAAIRCPTLVVTTDGTGLGSVDSIRAWQKDIAKSEFMVVPGDSYHVAATHPELCARAMVDFIGRRDK